jgi:plastocyanin
MPDRALPLYDATPHAGPRLALLALMLLATLLAACGKSTTTTSPPAGTGSTAHSPAAAPPPIVEAQDTTGQTATFSFAPPTITVRPGETVIFKNTGHVPHTATADDGSFDKTPLNPGDSFTTPPFQKVGTFQYKCIYHAAQGMVGTIVVSS